MDRAERKIAEQHLMEAEDMVAQGRKHIARQKRVIAELTRDGHDIASATLLLDTLQESQRMQEQHRDRLRKELGLNP